MLLNPQRRATAVEPSQHQLLIVLAALATAYVLTNLALPDLASGGFNLYVAQPLLWLALAFVCLRAGPRPDVSRSVIALGAAVGLAQTAGLVVAGVLFGLGESPYARDLLAICGNALHLGTMLLAMELARYRLLSVMRECGLPASTLLVALCFALLSLPLTGWRLLADGSADPLTMGGGRIVPAGAESLIATMLSAAAGPYAAFAYRAVLAAFEWTSPWLADLSWLQAAGTSIATTAVIGFALTAGRSPTQERRGVPAWAITTALVATGLIWLNTGLLGVQPALISGVSMKPTLQQGDVVIVKRMEPESLRVGDVIRFDAGGVPIVHRVMSVSSGPNGLVFITQGDNNDYRDAPVAAGNVHGRVVATLPKVGLLPIALRKLLGG